jgi:uncharacterized membrane protein
MNIVNLPVLGWTTLSEVHMRAFDSIIITHAITAGFAMLLGAMVLFMRKGSETHKALGKVWAASMVVAGLSAMFIPAEVFPLVKLGSLVWGPIHILIITTLGSLLRAIQMAREGKIRAHRGHMIGSYSGLVIAGAFAFTPGRMLHAWSKTLIEVMGSTPFWVTLCLATVIALIALGLALRVALPHLASPPRFMPK